ncbi:hypothetical protein ACFL0W_00595 [Nanoarchaeota archaeon]
MSQDIVSLVKEVKVDEFNNFSDPTVAYYLASNLQGQPSGTNYSTLIQVCGSDKETTARGVLYEMHKKGMVAYDLQQHPQALRSSKEAEEIWDYFCYEMHEKILRNDSIASVVSAAKPGKEKLQTVQALSWLSDNGWVDYGASNSEFYCRNICGTKGVVNRDNFLSVLEGLVKTASDRYATISIQSNLGNGKIYVSKGRIAAIDFEHKQGNGKFQDSEVLSKILPYTKPIKYEIDFISEMPDDKYRMLDGEINSFIVSARESLGEILDGNATAEYLGEFSIISDKTENLKNKNCVMALEKLRESGSIMGVVKRIEALREPKKIEQSKKLFVRAISRLFELGYISYDISNPNYYIGDSYSCSGDLTKWDFLNCLEKMVSGTPDKTAIIEVHSGFTKGEIYVSKGNVVGVNATTITGDKLEDVEALSQFLASADELDYKLKLAAKLPDESVRINSELPAFIAEVKTQARTATEQISGSAR